MRAIHNGMWALTRKPRRLCISRWHKACAMSAEYEPAIVMKLITSSVACLE
ncbi:hypothetical protein V6B33_12835 [Mangrovibacillus sp. Mu-81]|uniref:hypothetical protein n=1 Tax=Mangrovibacillus sp. Mu-81 TaxID=3121478 RepID=UPI002FE4D993